MKRLLVLSALIALLPVSAAAENAAWKQSWEETVAAAKQEGKVVIAAPPSRDLRRVLPEAFKAKYGITVDYLGGRSSESAGRMRAERQAGIYSIDVIFAGIQSMALTFHRGKMLQPLKPALQLPEVVDGKKWKKGKLWFADPEEQYILRLANTVTTMFHINTKDEVKPGDIRSAKDLLNPKYKGKIALQDPTIPGSGSNQAAHLYYQHGEDFVKALYIGQKPMITRDTRLITDGLVRGTYPITLGAEDADVAKMKKEGIPLEILELSDLYPEISASYGQVAIADNAPHPNAAKVFVNWIASKEGNEIFNRTMGTAPTRNDIDESYLPPELIPRDGVEYFDTYDWEFTVTKKEKVRKLMKELLSAR